MNMMEMLFGKKKDPASMAIEEALTLLEEKNFDAAIQVLREKALSRDPGHRRALLHLGICHMLKGELDVAEGILSPIANRSGMDSEIAAAGIALDKIRADRAKMQ